jgi:uncharacterized protein
MNNLKIFIIIFFLSVGYILKAQQPEPKNNGVVIVHSNLDGNIRLRWSPTTPEIWNIGKKNGYILEKKVIKEGSKYNNPPVTIIMGEGPFLPAPIIKWEQASEHNDYAAIIADAFFGESYSKKKTTTFPRAGIMNSLVEQNDKFAFSLISAELSYEAALLAGWGFIDNNIKPNGIYEYIVYLNLPNFKDKVRDTIRVDMSNKTSPPMPIAVSADFEENMAKISWHQNYPGHLVSSYKVERSSDGINYETLTSTPLISDGSDKKSNGQNTRGSFNDSIPNNIYFFYRVSSIDCFGDVSKPSKVVKGMAKRRLTAVPQNLKHTFSNYDTIQLQWEFDKEQEELIVGFEVYKSDSSRGEYKNISFTLPPTARSFKAKATNSNYFIVKAVGRDEYSTTTGLYFVLRPDLVPPLQPKGLKGMIDTTGTIQMEWLPNTDDDLDGYFVYSSYNDSSGFMKTSLKPIRETFYADTIDVKKGSKNIYYLVVAVDKAGNNSVPTEKLKLKIPDLIKPDPPLLYNTFHHSDTVKIIWLPSPSDDVVMQLVYRKERNDKAWKVLARYNDNTTNSIQDIGLEDGKTYSYLIIAVDGNKLESEPAGPVSFTIALNAKPKKVEKFTAKFDQQALTVNLSWKANASVKGYQIYKDDSDGENFFFFSFIEATENKLTDTDIKPFKTYRYKIRSMSEKGLYSPFEIVKVAWK